MPVRDVDAGMPRAPFGDHVGEVGQAGAEDERQPGRLDREAIHASFERHRPDAVVLDPELPMFADGSKVHPIHHEGKFFKVDGALNIERTPQGHPVIIQAGASDTGLELAARTADKLAAIATELDAPFVMTAGPALERKGDIAAFLTALEPRSVFFVDEIHRLPRALEETFWSR